MQNFRPSLSDIGPKQSDAKATPTPARDGHWQAVCGLLVGAADGLAYLHSRGVMHRDLKVRREKFDDCELTAS